jgi:hypothetical protein
MQHQEQEKEREEIRVEISVNKNHLVWDRWTITGLEVLDLAQETPEEYKVYIKRKGRDDDPVGVDQHVDLHEADNRHFRTVQKETTEG